MNYNRCAHPDHAVKKKGLIMGYVNAAVRSVFLVYVSSKALAPFGIMYTAVTAETHPPVNPYIPCGTFKALAGYTGIDLEYTPWCTPSRASRNTRGYKHRTAVDIVSKDLVIDAYIYVGKQRCRSSLFNRYCGNGNIL